MPELKAAKYVTALAEYKTIRAASEALFISPPALSMYIRSLEKEMGAELFTRDSKLFIPTEIGEKYIRRSYEILKIDREFQEELASWLRRETNAVSIGIYRRRGVSFMVPLIRALEEMLPDIQFSFHIGSVRELEQRLRDRELDYILITHRIHNPEFQYRHVCSDRLVLAVPASWESRTRISSDGMRTYLPIESVPPDQILMPGTHQSIYPFVEAFLSSHNVCDTVPNQAANMEILAQSVAAEMGCCFTLASYIPTFSHISGVRFTSPSEKETAVSWSLASLSSPLDPSRFSILKSAIHLQIARMIP